MSSLAAAQQAASPHTPHGSQHPRRAKKSNKGFTYEARAYSKHGNSGKRLKKETMHTFRCVWVVDSDIDSIQYCALDLQVPLGTKNFYEH